MFTSIYVFVLIITSVYTRVTVELDDNIISNVIARNTKINKLIGDKGTIQDTVINNSTESLITNEIEDRFNVTDIDDNIINTSDEDSPVISNSNETTRIDNGTALILTRYIEEEKYEEARAASKVNSEYFFGIESYSGFLTVNKTYNSNLFFWYFPVGKQPVNETPWIIWLQGGPGASSMTGLFDEVGPFTVDHLDKFKKNAYTWCANHSLLFIDNPVGTGFSFTDSNLGFTKDMATYSSHLYSALHQFLQVFPELRSAPLYIAGESYAGKYVPSLAMEIHRRKLITECDINLKGLIMGNAYVEPTMILNLTRPFYNFGLLDENQIKIVKPLQDAFSADIVANRSVAAKTKWNYLVTVLLLMTHQKHAYNFLRDDLAVGRYASLLKRSEIKRAIHVGDIKFGFVNTSVNTELGPDFLSNAQPLFETLLDHYRVLAYCGQLDQMLPCILTGESYRRWQWSGAEKFRNATRYPFNHNGKLAGYEKTGGGLTEVMIRGAGHMVPLDASGPAQALVTSFTRNRPLSHPSALLEGTFLRDFIKNASMINSL